MKIYNISVKREIIDLTENDSDEDKQSDTTVDVREENICSNDAKRCRNESIEQSRVSGKQTGGQRIKIKRMNEIHAKIVNVRRYED